jgi:predicted dithiol-disulfide oxidoreductase (DUF899 family)
MDTVLNADRDIDNHKVVAPQEWIEASQALLAQEKALTKQRDAVSRLRRELPWVRVTQDYLFDSSDGKETLDELFDGRSQLITYHFMYGPGWDEGCSGCSFVSDHIDAVNQHLRHHDVTLVAVSRAPLAEFQAFKKRMGWQFKWVSSNGCDFNYDFGVSYHKDELDRGKVLHNFAMQKLGSEEQPGLSVFYKNADGEIFHTYSSYERGLDMLLGTYNYLDLTPKGRNESGPMESWMRLHDAY